MTDSFINVTSAGAGRACVELHHQGDVIDISHLVSSVTWTMDADYLAALTLVTTAPGKVELEAALPDGLTVEVAQGACCCVQVFQPGGEDSLMPGGEECPVHQRP